MNSFLGVILFCMQGQCAFWKSAQFDNQLECEAVVLNTMNDMVQDKAEIVQGVCLPLEEKEEWQKTQG
jgi:hypothetical protein